MQEAMKYRSDWRTGEPPDHMRAKFLTGDYLSERGFDIYYEYPLFLSKYKHQYDVVGFAKNACFKAVPDGPDIYVWMFLTGTTDKLATHEYKKYFDSLVKIIIEVDDPNLHGKINRKIADGIAQSAAETYMPNAKFVRLNKHEINGELEDKTEYFRTDLDPFLR